MAPGVSEWPALQDPASDRLILRDGSVAVVRPSAASDREALKRFFRELTAESRHNRFFVSSEPPSDIVASFCESSDPTRKLTLIAFREISHEIQPIGVASYLDLGRKTAEVAFAVADSLHGKGLGTALLERLATIASRHGFEYFEANTLADNWAMLEVFRDSGFEMRSKTSQGVVDVRLVLQPSIGSVGAMDERNRQATVASLRRMLEPRSVAVIGASRNPENLGRRVFDGIVRCDFRGPAYAVNPAASEIAGRPCYASIRDVPAPVDLAILATPRGDVLRMIDECAAAGVRSLVIISAGFAELNDEGRRLQQAVVDKARAHGMRLVGPNCMGLLNTRPDIRLNASFADRLPPEGRLGIASQSGAVGIALVDLACARHIGISTFVSLGNKADVSGNDLLQWGESDPHTTVLLLYLESFGNPRRFAQLARRIGPKKPIVVVKAGRTPSGSRAAGSHTGGLASSEVAIAALFQQSGVIRADTIDQMFDVAQCLDLQPPAPGNRVGIITNAGGPGILAADACEAAGLIVNPFGVETREALAEKLPANASIGNPVDLVASAGPDAYEHAITTALMSTDIDSLIVVYTPIGRGQTAEILGGIEQGVRNARAVGVLDKPVLACTLSVATQPPPLVAGNERIPSFMFPENAARALGRAAAYARWRREPPALYWTFDDVHAEEANRICHDAVASRGDTWLTGDELAKLLGAFGLKTMAGRLVRTGDEAADVAGSVGYPVVLKLDSTKILHKTDVGGVRLHLQDEQAVRAAFRDLAARFPETVMSGTETTILVQPMVTGVETLVGIADDPSFGPLIAFGLGGVETEVLRDVAFRIAPLNERDADEMMRGVRSFPLLQGYRGRPAADLPAIKNLLLRVSVLAQSVPALRELDLNPVIVLPEGQGCRIVDARARVAPR